SQEHRPILGLGFCVAAQPLGSDPATGRQRRYTRLANRRLHRAPRLLLTAEHSGFALDIEPLLLDIATASLDRGRLLVSGKFAFHKGRVHVCQSLILGSADRLESPPIIRQGHPFRRKPGPLVSALPAERILPCLQSLPPRGDRGSLSR